MLVSAESFIRSYAPYPEVFKEMVAQRREQEKNKGQIRSPVALLSEMFIENGREGFKNVGVVVNLSDPSKSVFEKFLQISKDLSSVMIGSSILSVEDCFRYGSHNPQDFLDRVNRALSPSGFNIDIDKKQVEVFTPSEIDEMAAAARYDPTLSIFLIKRDLLPASVSRVLSNIINSSPAFKEHFEFFTGSYEKLAKLIIEKKPENGGWEKRLEGIDLSALNF
ncbi:MAG: hypothetical protein A2857_02000 [Candidatus Levybacteria bacterium RIFCSPHIGHO2_01_FULL_36_15]|nr:MAG: hypothetical protein A2857_02000 [Candidatus Levybacteria bacterium RIFCSPHIGHO2_01_FULL_36_15]